jgi:precorrin-6Y C5,15-methyltransferase (decarboxylating)
MADPLSCWLTILGMGEDGPEGLPPASRAALAAAEVIMAPPRHLERVPTTGAQRIEWPVPFAAGIAQLIALRGRRVVVLTSGDPFWFGAGSVIARHLNRAEWLAHPAPSTFSLAAARLGWPLEGVACLGLHAAPLARIRPHLAPGARIIATLRDGAAAADLAALIAALGFADSRVTLLQALGGPREAVREICAADPFPKAAHPVALAVDVAGPAMAALSRASGLPDDVFDHDGQITKRPVRALALSALAPRAGEALWDIGAGAGSVGIEWCLAHPANTATGFEADAARAARARENAAALGVAGHRIVEGRAPDCLSGHPAPAAVFVGGGASDGLLRALWDILPAGARVVAHAVTLDTEALLADWQARAGGSLLRIELAEAAPLGRLRAWKAAYPVVQWSVVR